MQRSTSYKMLPIFIILILIIVFISGVSVIILSQEPVYQQYTQFEGENITVYKNDELNVLFEERRWGRYIRYKAEWMDIDGNRGKAIYQDSKTKLLEKIIDSFAEVLSSDQLKWFDYMLKNVVK